MTDEELTLDERIEAWRKRWNGKIGADLFRNRKEDLKAMFRPKRWNKQHSSKLEGHLFRVKEYHEINQGICPACNNYRGLRSPGHFSDFKIELGFYNEKNDRFGHFNLNGKEKGQYVMPGTIVMATGTYIERFTWVDYPGGPDRQVEIITEKVVGYISYSIYLQPIKRSEIEARLSMK